MKNGLAEGWGSQSPVDREYSEPKIMTVYSPIPSNPIPTSAAECLQEKQGAQAILLWRLSWSSVPASFVSLLAALGVWL